MTKKQADTYRLDDYRRALADQDHLIQPTLQISSGETYQQEEAEAPVDQRESFSARSGDEAARQIPILVLPKEETEESKATIQDGENPPGDSKGTGRLVLADGDSCSDASFCDYRRTNRPPRSATQDRASKGMRNDSSDEDGDYDRNDDGVGWDSDLDSQCSDPGKLSHAKKMRRWASLAKGRFEKMLLDCIVNTDRFAPNYQDIFVSKSTIEKLEHVTTLCLTRPQAFGHGVLKGNKVTGAILYGPPGTGKSLLAKGMAKQSGFTMLAVSTAELWQKCHGEDEKVIRTVFSLARKLYPSIVFIDEADAMLGARKAGEKRHIRAMLNAFLMEWDGLTSGDDSPFILLATNRPFDLDPAVLRRAPVHIHLDVPTVEERLGIIRLLLREEVLDPNINHFTLSSLTQGFTGSDLKNLCVMAATECVSKQPLDTTRRILTRQHFFSALETIRATNVGKTMANEFKNFEKNAGHETRRDDDE